MCGIVGIFGQDAGARRADIDVMLSAVQSRGETDEVLINGVCSVAVRRLKIVDRQRAVQPIFNEDGSKFIIFNGEIFNFKQLKRQVEQHHRFTTESDTETILHAFEEYGERCLDHLDGQFAFVIYDQARDVLFGARDPLGIVPLYFVRDEATLFVASTVGALTHLGRPIRAVPPGHTLDLHGGLKRYFRPAVGAPFRSPSEAIPQLKRALQCAVAKRVDTDLPIAVMYSGGIDSTIVLHEAIKSHPDVTAFTIGASSSEDLAVSQRFCAERGIRQIVVPMSRRDVSSATIERAIKATELSEYLDIINAVVSLPLFHRIHQEGIKIVLGGDGSDELFGGYEMYRRVSGPDATRLFLHKLQTLNRTELQRVDRSSMAYEVETRVPFLDAEVVRIALKMRREWTALNDSEKWILREAYRDDLPSYITRRHKNPLSHSSGIHEWVRIYKPLFARYYKRYRFDLHEPMRRDFSYILASNEYDVERAIAEESASRDYPLMELLKESAKASVRTYVLGSIGRA